MKNLNTHVVTYLNLKSGKKIIAVVNNPDHEKMSSLIESKIATPVQVIQSTPIKPDFYDYQYIREI